MTQHVLAKGRDYNSRPVMTSLTYTPTMRSTLIVRQHMNLFKHCMHALCREGTNDTPGSLDLIN